MDRWSTEQHRQERHGAGRVGHWTDDDRVDPVGPHEVGQLFPQGRISGIGLLSLLEQPDDPPRNIVLSSELRLAVWTGHGERVAEHPEPTPGVRRPDVDL